MFIDKDLNLLLQILPNHVKLYLQNHPNRFNLIEIVLDLGRRPEGRFFNGSEYLSQKIISWQDLDFCTKLLGNFNTDNRTGIEKTLHRVSCLKNKKGNIIGLTCRIGRVLFGSINIIRDLLDSGQSILILGKPGIGKTTMIREVSRILSDEMEKRVVIVDTSNEIGGDGDIPHSGIGRSRRIQVAKSELQHNVMIEAVENHMPEVIIIDEIGSELEVLAARTIAERGVQLIGTVHGNSLESLIKNPILSDIVGGVHNVILSDEEARKRGSQKSILERKTSATFEIVIEINQKDNWFVHENTDQSVDLLLQKQSPFLQIRINKENNKVIIKQKILEKIYFSNEVKKNLFYKYLLNYKSRHSIENFKSKIFLYCYSISINKVQQICKLFDLNIFFTKDISKANAILALKSYLKENKKIAQVAKNKQIPIYIIKKNTLLQIVKTVCQILK
jgi:stage III sporulation protein SpoIIIAA